MRLQDRGVPCSDCCPHCETNYENDWHVFIGCVAAKQVWIEAGLWDVIAAGIDAATGLASHLFTVFCRLQNHLCRDIAAVLWCIWRRRNDKVWEDEVQNACMAVQLAREGIFSGKMHVNSKKTVNSSRNNSKISAAL